MRKRTLASGIVAISALAVGVGQLYFSTPSGQALEAKRDRRDDDRIAATSAVTLSHQRGSVASSAARSIDWADALDRKLGPAFWSKLVSSEQGREVNSTSGRLDVPRHILEDELLFALVYLARIGTPASQPLLTAMDLLKGNRYRSAILGLSIGLNGSQLREEKTWSALIACQVIFDDPRVAANRTAWDTLERHNATPEDALSALLFISADVTEVRLVCEEIVDDAPFLCVLLSECENANRAVFCSSLLSILKFRDNPQEVRKRAARSASAHCDACDFNFVWLVCSNESDLGVFQAVADLARRIDVRRFVELAPELAKSVTTEGGVVLAELVVEVLQDPRRTFSDFLAVLREVSSASEWGSMIVNAVHMELAARTDLRAGLQEVIDEVLRASLGSLNPRTRMRGLELVSARPTVGIFAALLCQIRDDPANDEATRGAAERLLER